MAAEEEEEEGMEVAVEEEGMEAAAEGMEVAAGEGVPAAEDPGNYLLKKYMSE